MAKKYGFDPFILLTEGGDPGVSGGGTGQGGSQPIPIPYTQWVQTSWAGDYVPATPGTDEVDYVVWFLDNNLGTRDELLALNNWTWNSEWDQYLD